MEFINQTPFEFAMSPWEADPKSWRLTFIVKATFDLAPDGEATVAAEQLPPTGDEAFEDVDDDLPQSIRYASDFAFAKPRADVMVVGKCHTPGCTPLDMCGISFRVGQIAKSLMVFGDRTWSHKLGIMAVPTEPRPFTEMPLRYENSFGGAGYKKNPIGKGSEKEEGEEGKKQRPLPNIEDPDELVSSPGNRPEPVGFGPLHAMWPQRYAKVGKFGAKWLKERWPCLPDDFDWTYFNAAPFDQQAQGYLRGDEDLFFEHLHPEHAQHRSRLPGLRVRCFLRYGGASRSAASPLQEVHMDLDTLWADMEAEKVVLVWRGNAPVASADFEDVQDVLVLSEFLTDKPKTLPECEAVLHRALQSDELEFEEEKPEEGSTSSEDDAHELAQVDEQIKQAEISLKAALVEAGLDPEKALEEASAQAHDEELAAMEKYGIEMPEVEQATTREDVIAAVKDGESLTDKDLRTIDLSQAPLAGARLEGAILTGVNLRGADLSGANLEAANLSGADLSSARLKGANFTDADLTQATLVAADLSEARIDGAVFEGAIATNVVMQGTTGKGAIFSEAELTGGQFHGCKLAMADFSRATIDATQFKQAELVQALFDGAKGSEVDMSRTLLTDASFSEGCELPGASFHQVDAKGSVWEKAILLHADFSAASLEGADFTEARLDGAKLDAADIRFGQFTKASLKGALMRTMNLFQGSMEKADLTGADLSGSNLYGVDFLDAVTDGANLKLANVKMTKLA